jgi:CRP/FNR family transcriptional regulator, dissimilatory nitrate respiration regulator
MFAQARFPVCAEAVGAASALVIPRNGFARSLATDPQIALLMLGSLSLRLRHLVERIEQLQVKSAPQRLGDFLVRLCRQPRGAASVELPFAKALVAQRLGMRPETLSRAMGALRTVGVTARGSRVAIRDVARLRAFCEAPRSEDRAPPYGDVGGGGGGGD